MNEYASLSEIRSYLTLGSGDTGDDSVLRSFLRASSRAIDKFTRRKFYPELKTLYYDQPSNPLMIKFRDDILEVKGLSHLNGTAEIDSGAYFLKCGAEYNLTPYDRLVIKDDSGSTINYSGTPMRAAHVSAVIGYHEDYNNAWIDSSGSLTSLLASNVSLASVSGSGNENSQGLFPRFSTEQIWKVGSGSNEEYMYVVDTSPFSSNSSVVKVIRGINGTTAREHAASTTIYTFDVEPDIVRSTKRLTTWLYEQTKSPYTGKVLMPAMGQFIVPEEWPVDVKDAMTRFVKSKVDAGGF